MDRHIINIKASILDGLNKLNALSGAIMTLFAIDDDGHIRGTVTDGDIRRALISGAQLTDDIGNIMHTEYKAIKGDKVDVAAIKACRAQGIRLIPWLNPDNTLRRLVDLSEGRSMLPVSAILMAGGKGERLRPLTLTTPKPLLEIGGKAIIDYNIEALARCGVDDITVTTRYLAEKIAKHFAKPRYGVQVKCVEETSPLGTIGSAALTDIPEEGYTIVMNSDLLTNISFEDMYLHHLSTGADITVAVIPYQVSVPFAILTTDPTDPERITGIEEKPTYSYFANAGIYIFPNSMLRALPTDSRTDATDLIEDAISSGLRVTEFPINGTWIDIGSPADFRQASELIKLASQSPVSPK